MKGSRVETIQNARKGYKRLLEEVWKKTSIFKKFIKDKSPFSNAIINNLEDYAMPFQFHNLNIFTGNGEN